MLLGIYEVNRRDDTGYLLWVEKGNAALSPDVLKEQVTRLSIGAHLRVVYLEAGAERHAMVVKSGAELEGVLRDHLLMDGASSDVRIYAWHETHEAGAVQTC